MIVHVVLLLFFTAVAGTSADLSRISCPRPRCSTWWPASCLGHWDSSCSFPNSDTGSASLGPKVEVLADLRAVARAAASCHHHTRLRATTLGGALALWASVHAFGGTVSFITVTVVTMVGGTLVPAAPTPGGVGAVEAALVDWPPSGCRLPSPFPESSSTAS